MWYDGYEMLKKSLKHKREPITQSLYLKSGVLRENNATTGNLNSAQWYNVKLPIYSLMTFQVILVFHLC